VNRGLLFALFVLMAAAPAAFADGIAIQICYSAAPNAYGSTSWSGYAANAILGLENGCATEGLPGPEQYTSLTWVLAGDLMVTSFPSWAGQIDPSGAYAGEEGERLHAGVIVQGNGTKVSLSELNYGMESSDPGNGLGFSGNFSPASDSNNDYGALRVGVIYGGGGGPNTYITSGPSDQLVDAFYYVGIGNAFWPCVDSSSHPTCFTPAEEQAGLDAQANYIYSNGGNSGLFTVATTYSLKDASGNTLASVTEDISTPEPAAVLLMGGGLLALAGFARRRRSR
jgi:hypothetical protein